MLLVLSFFCLQQSFAQSQQSLRYTYDQSGNLIRIDTAQTDVPPQVLSIEPPLALSGRTREFVASGSDLLNAVVSTTRQDVVVSTLHTALDSVRFRLQLADDAELTNIPLIFQTPLGQANISLPVLPPMSASPVPVIVAVSDSLPLRLRFEREAPADTDFQLLIDDSTIASSVATITIPAGQLGPTADPAITGLSLGATGISVQYNGVELLRFSVQVVAGQFIPADGDAFASAALGIVKESIPADIVIGPVVSSLGVEKLTTPLPGEITLTTQTTTVLVGSGINNVAPDRIMRGSNNVTVTVNGHGLQNVDQIILQPADDINVALTDVAADGRTVTFAASVTEQAVTGIRSLALAAGGSLLPVITPGANLINITGDAPVIDSVSPVLVPVFSEQQLIVRGQRFGADPLLSIEPSTGIELDPTPAVNSQGTELIATMLIAADAAPGPRVIVVSTAAGDSGSNAGPANTLTVSAATLTEITPLASPLLGVAKGMPAGNDLALLDAPLLGVSLGRVVTGLSPRQGEIGQNVMLELSGTDLSGVDEVLFEPADGLIASDLVAENNSISINVEIDAFAPQLPRKVTAKSSGIAIPAVHGADIWQIVPPAPVVDALTPNFVIAGGASQQITVKGQFLQNTQSVRLSPAANMIVGNLQVIDATTLSMAVSADVAASLGDRLLQIITATGTSSAIAVPNNTLRVVLPDQIVPDFAAPLLGVLVDSQPQPQPRDVYATALLIAKAPVATAVEPSLLIPNASALIEVIGSGLDAVDNIVIVPADDISIAELSVSGNGDRVSFMLAVDAIAEPGLRTLQLLAGAQSLPFATPGTNLIRIADEQPVIDSITPNSGFAGAGFTMIIRGRNLRKASAVTATPATGMIFAAVPVVNGDGTEISINVTLATDAPAGPRLIQVQTPSGSSSSQATPANTFNILQP